MNENLRKRENRAQYFQCVPLKRKDGDEMKEKRWDESFVKKMALWCTTKLKRKEK